MKLFRWLFIWLFTSSLLTCIAVVSAQAPAYPLPIGSPVIASGSMLELPSRRLLIANALSDTVSILAPRGGIIDAEIEVGQAPSSVALAQDGVRAAVVNREDGTVSVVDLLEESVLGTYEVGQLPYAALVRDGTIYVSVQGDDEIVLLDLETGTEQARIAVPDAPSGLAIWGSWLYITHYWSGELSLIDRASNTLMTTLAMDDDVSLSASIAIDRRNGLAYLPQTVTNAQLVNAAPEARMLPVINVVDLSEMMLRQDLQIFLPLVDRMMNMPHMALIDRGRNLLYITHAGSATLTAMDMDTDYALYGFRHLNTGAAPGDIVLSADALTLYIHNTVDQTITEFDAYYRSLSDTMSTSNIVPDALSQVGARLFYDANDRRLSAQHSTSCANCHMDGLSDGRTWGGAVTPILRQGAASVDEAVSVDTGWLDTHIQAMQGGTGLGADSIEAQALMAYLQELAALPPSR
ncbi:hypothetical protein G4Y79_21425 [Phototrophicus methaneseepsis]|uniref:Cytochrome c domain-containing protein n=1 Tax=Phototrophicus methaneseepsis TaxID=2710758 RepID=A0A7S8E8J1_9CHLR|nr:YncE family protein [Phototrophicus methaneseepsis]QPC82219.1 hypothetical protein G4Y79_21425 [Phototrophicus methaneseepsis]